MKKNIFFFWVVLIVSVIAVDRIVGKVFSNAYKRQSQGIVGKLNYLARDGKDKVLFMGSSKTEHAYRSVILDGLLGKSVYNAGFAGKIISFHHALLHLVVSHHTPETVILDVTDKDMWDLGKNEAFEELYTLTPFYGQSPILDSLLVAGSPTEKIKLYSHTYPYNSALTNLLKTSDKLERGFGHLNKKWKDSLRANERQYSVLDSTRLDFLEGFMATCKHKGIRLICVISPVYMLSDGKEFDPLRELCRRYELELLDSYQLDEFLNNRTLFADKTHLNTKGATEFSKKIGLEIKELLESDSQ